MVIQEILTILSKIERLYSFPNSNTRTVAVPASYVQNVQRVENVATNVLPPTTDVTTYNIVTKPATVTTGYGVTSGASNVNVGYVSPAVGNTYTTYSHNAAVTSVPVTTTSVITKPVETYTTTYTAREDAVAQIPPQVNYINTEVVEEYERPYY